jgi:large subunit ribosomal protein L31
MKKNIHPKYQKVLFIDSASGHKFVCGSTLQTEATQKFQGEEYPVSYLSISSSSHPFFTGSKQLVDSEGRVEKFKKRFDRKKEVSAEAAEAVEAVKPVEAKPEVVAEGKEESSKKKAPAVKSKSAKKK